MASETDPRWITPKLPSSDAGGDALCASEAGDRRADSPRPSTTDTPTRSGSHGGAQASGDSSDSPDPTSSANAAGGAERKTRDDVACNARPDPIKPWRTRPSAHHLVQAANGIYYVRLVIPERIRLAHPGLPREIRRSTNSRTKIHALEKAREMCRYLETSTLHLEGSNMLVNHDALPPPKRGFSLECTDGVIRLEIFAGSDSKELNALMRVLPVIHETLSVVARAEPDGQFLPSANEGVFGHHLVTTPTESAANKTWMSSGTVVGEHDLLVTPTLPGAIAGAGRSHATAASITQGATTLDIVPPHPREVTPCAETPACSPDHARAPDPNPARPAQADTDASTALRPCTNGAQRIEWLSDAIQEWRTSGPILFSNQTWIDSSRSEEHLSLTPATLLVPIAALP